MVEFKIRMRFLDGAVQQVQVLSDTPIQYLQAGFVENHPFHVAKFFIQGDCEVLEGTVAEAGLTQDSELQIVLVKEHKLALAAVEHAAKTFFRSGVTKDTLVTMRPALEFLCEVDDLEPELCQQFLRCFFDEDFRAGYPWPSWDNPYFGQIYEVAGKTFGQACANPKPFVPTLCQCLPNNFSLDKLSVVFCSVAFAVSALQQLDSRHGDLLSAHAFLLEQHLVFACSSEDLAFLLTEPNTGGVHRIDGWPGWRVGLLALFVKYCTSDAALEVVLPFLQFLKDNSNHSPHELVYALSDALEEFEKQIQQTQQIPMEISQAADVAQDANVLMHMCTDAAEHIQDCETEKDLEQALNESEAEALQQEQAQLHEAILKSKAPYTAAAPATITVVVLKYSQSKNWFVDALMNSLDLQEERDALVGAGFSPVLPSGAKIFVDPHAFQAVARHFEDEDLKTSHVIVAEELESKVLKAVEAARACATKSTKNGSCKVTCRKELSVAFDGESMSQASAVASDSTPFLVVKRTFVHILVPSSMRSASSFQPPTV